ncbi:hypothetical protein [Oryzobacter terrae]|uniref:hypothetical protein n=1 Tax=Oryzobacter terrae TaxID=1620385 RepID=UPI00367300B0
MTTSTVVWIVIAVVVLALLVALVSRSRGQRTGAQRAKAAAIREEAAEQDRLLREREADAARLAAEADLAKAHAAQRALEAERLTEQAQARLQHTDGLREERDDRRREADRRDPDVRTDAHGNRLDDREA